MAADAASRQTSLTIVTYHYVRDLAHSRFPRLRGLTVDEFEAQLDYLVRHFTVCAVRDVVAAAAGRAALPRNACLLTFDDGLLEHFTVVFPRLLERGLVGCFYPPGAAVCDREVLDVHKIHLILACAARPEELGAHALAAADRLRDRFDIPPAEDLRQRYARPGRYDGAEIMLAKRLLQDGLPGAVRTKVIAELFAEHVGVEERTIAGEFYVDLAQLRCMGRCGMEIGGHGWKHVRLELLSREEQTAEIDRMMWLLAAVHGNRLPAWSMSYPYGSYDQATMDLLAASGCVAGMTTKVAVADLAVDRLLELPRMNTNDFPRTRSN